MAGIPLAEDRLKQMKASLAYHLSRAPPEAPIAIRMEEALQADGTVNPKLKHDTLLAEFNAQKRAPQGIKTMPVFLKHKKLEWLRSERYGTLAGLITPGARTQGGMDRVMMVEDDTQRHLFTKWRLNKMINSARCRQCDAKLTRKCIRNCPRFLGNVFIPRDLIPTEEQRQAGLSPVDIALNKQLWDDAYALIAPLLEA